MFAKDALEPTETRIRIEPPAPRSSITAREVDVNVDASMIASVDDAESVTEEAPRMPSLPSCENVAANRMERRPDHGPDSLATIVLDREWSGGAGLRAGGGVSAGHAFRSP